MQIRPLYLLLGVLISAGCHDLTAPDSLGGTWKQAHTFPGNSLSFSLAINGDAISGSGKWTGEACCDGTETIIGTDVAGTVTLEFAFVTRGGAFPPPRTSRFIGRMTGRDTLVGTFGSDPATSDVVFVRAN